MRTIHNQPNTVEKLRRYTKNGKRNPFEEFGAQGKEFRKGLMEIILKREISLHQVTYLECLDVLYRFASENGVDIKQPVTIRQKNVLNWLADGKH